MKSTKRFFLFLFMFFIVGCAKGVEPIHFNVLDIGTSESFDFELLKPEQKTENFQKDTKVIVAYFLPEANTENLPVSCQWKYEGEVLLKQDIQFLNDVYNACWIVTDDSFNQGTYRFEVLFANSLVRFTEFTVLNE